MPESGSTSVPVLPISRRSSVSSVGSRRSRTSVGITNRSQLKSAVSSFKGDEEILVSPSPLPKTPVSSTISSRKSSLSRPLTAPSYAAPTVRVKTIHDAHIHTEKKEMMFYPPREHKGPLWLHTRDEASQVRFSMVKPIDDTMWITNPSLDGYPHDVNDRFTPMSRIPESFAAEAKMLKEMRTASRAERMKRNQERVLMNAYAEDQEKAALEEKRLNGYRQQRIQYLAAVALRSD